MPDLLTDANGNATYVRAGGSCNIYANATDANGANLTLAQLLTVTLTLIDKTTEAVINSRSDIDIKNANDCVVTSGGAITVRLDGSDNQIVGTVVAYKKQRHVARITWTWNDGVKDRTGKDSKEIDVEAWPTPT